MIVGLSVTGDGAHISLSLLCSIFIYYAFEQCSKKLPIMLNIMPMTTAMMPQFVYDFIIVNDQISIVRLQINVYLLF